MTLFLNNFRGLKCAVGSSSPVPRWLRTYYDINQYEEIHSIPLNKWVKPCIWLLRRKNVELCRSWYVRKQRRNPICLAPITLECDFFDYWKSLCNFRKLIANHPRILHRKFYAAIWNDWWALNSASFDNANKQRRYMSLKTWKYSVNDAAFHRVSFIHFRGLIIAARVHAPLAHVFPN